MGTSASVQNSNSNSPNRQEEKIKKTKHYTADETLHAARTFRTVYNLDDDDDNASKGVSQKKREVPRQDVKPLKYKDPKTKKKMTWVPTHAAPQPQPDIYGPKPTRKQVRRERERLREEERRQREQQGGAPPQFVRPGAYASPNGGYNPNTPQRMPMVNYNYYNMAPQDGSRNEFPMSPSGEDNEFGRDENGNVKRIMIRFRDIPWVQSPVRRDRRGNIIVSKD